MSQPFFDLRASHNPHRWHLPLDHTNCVGREPRYVMYGGIGLAASVAALERTCKRPVVWVTAQYLSFAQPGQVLDLDVWLPVNGNVTTQARVNGHVGDKEIISVIAALGSRPGGPSVHWRGTPDVPPPEDCPNLEIWEGQASMLHGRLEARGIPGRVGYGNMSGKPSADGRAMFWLRSREGQPTDASMLAVFADYVPSAAGAALGRRFAGNSLDNTLRVRRLVETEWVLCDIRVTSVHDGFGYGEMDLYAENGELLATASQSFILRDLPAAG